MPSVATNVAIMESSKKYLVVKNHVREIHEPCNSISNTDDLNEFPPLNRDTIHKSKKRKKSEKVHQEDSTFEDQTNQMSQSDLNELREVYFNCKSVLHKIEAKYGRLLGLGEGDYVSRKRKHDLEEKQIECMCLRNNKVVFDEDGVESREIVDRSLEHHICATKLQSNNRYHSVQIETENDEILLPDNIRELQDMLKGSKLPIVLRNKVIDKIKFIRHENLNMIRFEKQFLVQKLKSNPDEIIDFKGTNFSSILGYPSKPD